MLTLQDILNLNHKSDNSLIHINGFISELIPVFHSFPYRITKEDTVEHLYDRFIKREIGGWCGLFTKYMVMILEKCGISAYVYNYGIKGTEFTHTIIVAKDYFWDPYFDKFYVDNNGKLIKMQRLLKMIKEGNYSFFPVYGSSNKTKRIDQMGGHKFITISGKEWEESLMKSWREKFLVNIMSEKFNTSNPYYLMLHKV